MCGENDTGTSSVRYDILVSEQPQPRGQKDQIFMQIPRNVALLPSAWGWGSGAHGPSHTALWPPAGRHLRHQRIGPYSL